MIGQHAPSSEIDRLVDRIARLEERIADLIRAGRRGGLIARTTASASAWTNASTSTYTAITASTGSAPSITVALDPSRRYRATFVAIMTSSVDGDRAALALYTDAVQGYGWGSRVGPGAVYVATDWQIAPTDSATHVYDVRARVGGGGSGTLSAAGTSSTTPMMFSIEDIGPA